jgi:hypothetical protein
MAGIFTPLPMDASLQEVARRLHAGQSTVEETLEWMKTNGSSVLLNWGEDTNAWECSWISGGKRFTGCQTLQRLSILESLNKCFADCLSSNEGLT